MKTAKLTIGIASIILSLVVLLQSCVSGVGSAMNNAPGGGISGILVALLMIVGGIAGVAGRNSRGGSAASAVIYAVAGIVGLLGAGAFRDMFIWGILCLIFAAVFAISAFQKTIGRYEVIKPVRAPKKEAVGNQKKPS